MNKVLRGDALKMAIKEAIKKQVNEAKKSNKTKINLSALAVLVGTTRTTLNKMKDFIDECISEAKFERRTSTGSSERNALEEKIKKMEKIINSLTVELNGLRNNHIEIYRRLYANSSDLAGLIKPVLIKPINENHECILCGSKQSKVVSFIKSDTDNK